MNNQEKKQQLWAEIQKKYAAITSHCTIECAGLDDDSTYFHPRFRISEDVFISSQCDTGNKHIYALIFNSPTYYCDIYDDLLEPIILGYDKNKEVVEQSLQTLSRLRNHINQLNNLSSEYIVNIIIGNAIEETAGLITTELNLANRMIKFLKQQQL